LVSAGDFNWNNTGTGNWADGANWTPAGPPGGGGGNFAIINNGGTAEITSDTGAIQDPFIGRDGGTGTVNHSAGVLNASAGWAFIGINGGNGTYNMTGSSTLNTGRLYVGGRGGAGSGTMTVNTSGSVNISAFRIADNDGSAAGGTGAVTISSGTINSGGEMQVGRWGGVGTVNQTGGVVNVNAGWFGIANDNAGSAGSSYSLSGGSLNLNGTVGAEVGADTAGTFNLSGTGAMTAHQLFVGFRNGGNGAFNMSGGTLTVRAGESRVGANVGATGVFNLSGGTFNADSTFQVGAAGSGTMNMTGGVLNNNGWLAVGRFNGGSGVLNVSAGSIIHTNNGASMLIGEEGMGTVNLSGTGLIGINSSLGVRIGHTATGNGTLNLDGGTFAAQFFQKTDGASLAKINFNGGLVQALAGSSNFFVGFSDANLEVKSGGLRFDTNGFDAAVNQGLSGAGGLTKSGLGTLTLNGISTYTGRTIINNGTLKLGAGGSLNPLSEITVAAGASFDGSAVAGGIVIAASQELNGNGSITGDVTVNGTLAPGASIGALTIAGSLTLAGTSDFELDPSLAPGQTADLTSVSGNMAFGGTLNLSLIGGSLTNGQTFNLFDFGTTSGSFSTINWPSGTDSTYWINNLSTNGTLTYVPEPTGAALTLLGLLALGRRRRA
jgi:autotransporter-associated beta strand protein